MFDRLLNEAFQGMKMLSPLYWIVLFITVVVIVVFSVRLSSKSEKERETFYLIFLFACPFVPYFISAVWYFFTYAFTSFSLIVDFILVILSAALIYAFLTTILFLLLYAVFHSLDNANIIRFDDPGNLMLLFTETGFGFLYTYSVISFVLFNQFYWLFQ
jgi:hypothetical protein